MRRWPAALAAAAFLLARQAEAHAFGARYDLPLPLGLYLTAAGAAVAASFLGALLFLRGGEERSFALVIRFPPWSGRLCSVLLGLMGLLLLALLLGAAFAGPQDALRNLATIGVWVIWWVGFLLFTALVIGLWPQLDPFRRLSGLLARALGRPWGQGSGPPAAAGFLAPLGLLAIAWLELVSDWSESPKTLGLLILLYLLVALAGGLAFGEGWFRIADPLTRIFTALARVAPLALVGGSSLRLRPPGEGLLEPQAPPAGEVALVCGLIGVVLFDGLSETPAWAALLDFVSESQALRPLLLWLREQGADLMKVIRTLGLLATLLIFYGAYRLLILLMRSLDRIAFEPGQEVAKRRRQRASHSSCGAASRFAPGAFYETHPKGFAPADGEPNRQELARDFVGTLLPIAVAYHLSHYVSYLLIAGQLILPAASDPFGRGWDLFGLADRPLDIGVIGAQQVWWIAFTALIAGHALSVLLAHRRALALFHEPRRAALSQIPMTLAMIGLTVLSLWILSQPITE